MPKFAVRNLFGIFYQGLGRFLGTRKGSRGGCLLTAKFHKKTIKNKIISKDYL